MQKLYLNLLSLVYETERLSLCQGYTGNKRESPNRPQFHASMIYQILKESTEFVSID